ncbi:sugar-transfer associated ATP-grasp domain-containing protein [Candidatus Bipolaricaulota bacterium]
MTRIRAWRLGFLTRSYIAYGLSQQAVATDDYVTDYERWVKTFAFNGSMGGWLLSNKLAFSWMMQSVGFSAHVPSVFALLRGGATYSIDQETGFRGIDGLLRRLDVEGRLVVKPTGGARGQGLLMIGKTDSGIRVNGMVTSCSELVQLLLHQRESIAMRHVSQHEYARRVFPETVNTIRVLTLCDDEGAFAAIAVHRFGTRQSVPADNWSRGGVCSLIDLSSGTLGPGMCLDSRGHSARHEVHPDTREPIAGLAIPRWQDVLSGVLSMAEAVAFIPYVGWDIIVTPDTWVVLEGNTCTDVNLLQIHAPLLTQSRVRRFFDIRGVTRGVRSPLA